MGDSPSDTVGELGDVGYWLDSSTITVNISDVDCRAVGQHLYKILMIVCVFVSFLVEIFGHIVRAPQPSVPIVSAMYCIIVLGFSAP